MSQRTCKRTEVYPRYLRSNAARAPKHRLWEPPQNDRQSWPSTFGCEMFTVNVCVESCLHRVIITSAIERNVKRWRLQPGRLRYQPRTLCVSSRIALARTVLVAPYASRLLTPAQHRRWPSFGCAQSSSPANGGLCAPASYTSLPSPRSPITPDTARTLIQNGFEIFVEHSDNRAFSDEEFAAAGCKMV